MTGIKQWQIKPGTTMIIGKAAPQFEYGDQYREEQNRFLFFSLGNMDLYYDYFFRIFIKKRP
ncbi:hypothetical protein NS380_09865 [Pantoea dispersa]|nr:hypothetical protein NS380_09865 [Pantoea dispersa]